MDAVLILDGEYFDTKALSKRVDRIKMLIGDSIVEFVGCKFISQGHVRKVYFGETEPQAC